MPGYLYRTGAPFDVQLVIFGKDGTLLDSEAVRLPALKECTAVIAHTAGEPALLPALLKAGGWEDTEKGPTLSPDSVMACGTTLELAQRWIDTQPIVAARWHEEAAALCAETCSTFVVQATFRFLPGTVPQQSEPATNNAPQGRLQVYR